MASVRACSVVVGQIRAGGLDDGRPDKLVGAQQRVEPVAHATNEILLRRGMLGAQRDQAIRYGDEVLRPVVHLPQQ